MYNPWRYSYKNGWKPKQAGDVGEVTRSNRENNDSSEDGGSEGEEGVETNSLTGEIRELGEEEEQSTIEEIEDQGSEDEEMEGSKRRIKIGSWNCDGLFEKLSLNGVSEYINSLDIAVLGETFTFSSFDFSIKFGDYIVLHDPAKKFNIRGRPSGGIAILVKKSLEQFISIIDTKISHVLCFKLAKELLNTSKDIIFIGTYVHPPR